MKSRHAPPALMTFALAVTVLVTLQSPARAETDVDLRAGFYTDADAFALGGGLLTAIGSHRGWYFNPNLELAMPDGGSVLSLNADVHYDFPSGGSLSPYLGAGPALVRFSPDRGDASTDLGLNMFAGIAGMSSGVRPFLQLKGVVASGSEVSLMGGIRF